MLSIILSCVTEVRYVMVEGGGGVGNSGVFLAHNYLSEQFGNYVEYGIVISSNSILAIMKRNRNRISLFLKRKIAFFETENH